MQIDKNLLTALRADINAALAAVGEKHNVQLLTGNARYSSDNATFKLEVNTIGDSGEAVSKELAALRAFYPDIENKQVTLRGEQFTVVGYKTRARKNSFQIKNAAGTVYVTTASAVGARG